jgi:endoglucanase
MAATYRNGVILHHWLAMPMERVRGASNVPHTYAAPWFDEEDVAWLAEHGFDHILFAIDADLWLRPDGSLDDGKLAPFEAALGWCQRHGLGAVAQAWIADVPGATLADAGERARHAAVWGQIARRFAARGDELRFVVGSGLALGPKLDAAVANELARAIVTRVRSESPERFVYVSPAIRRDAAFVADPDASFATLDELWLPDGDGRVGVTVEYSEPEAFSWQTDRAAPRLRFPGVSPSGAVHTLVELADDFDRLAAWQHGRGAGREVYLSYIGMHDPADALSTRSYMNAVTSLAARHHVGWAVFDYESAYAVRGPDGKPTPLYDGLGLHARGTAPSPFTYDRGLLIAHWLGGIAPRYEGQSSIPHTYGAPWFDAEDIRWIADHGFDHLQIPVDAREWRPGLPAAKLEPFERALALANAAGLGVVLIYDPDGVEPIEQIAREWGAIAEHFAAVGDGLRFHAGDVELPPTDPRAARFRAYLAAIRHTSPKRFCYLPVQAMGEAPPGKLHLTGTAERDRAAVRALELPAGDDRIGLSFEYWEPQVFTMQFHRAIDLPLPGRVPDFRKAALPKASYTDRYNALAAAASNQELRIEAIVDDLAGVAATVAAEAPGRPLYLRRFGMPKRVEPIALRRYLSIVSGAARALGMGWSVYDYESERAIRGPDGSPNPGYHGLGLVPRAAARGAVSPPPAQPG